MSLPYRVHRESPPWQSSKRSPAACRMAEAPFKDGPVALMADGRDNPLTQYLSKAEELVTRSAGQQPTHSTSSLYSQGGNQEGLMVS